MTLTCPICGRQGVDESRETCPQCDADLTCFHLLDSFPDDWPASGHTSSIEKHRVTPRGLKWALGVLLASTLCLYVLLSVQMIQLADHVKQLESEQHSTSQFRQNVDQSFKTLTHLVERRAISNQDLMDTVHKSLDQLQADVARLESMTSDIQKSKEPSPYWTYEATADDTLWDIANTYLPHAHYYPLLLESTPGLGIYNIGKGVHIRIPKDTSNMKSQYKQITKKTNQGLLWKYTVVPGDTLEGIAQKFYNSPEHISKITALNPGISITPGTKVTIELQ